MLNKFFIRLVMFGSPFLRSMGVDMVHLKVILQMKCRVDDRRPAGLAMYQNSNTKKSSEKGKNVMFFILGALLSGILFISNPLMAHALYITAFMVYVINSLIIDFSNVLIDVRDHYFIVSRPVNDKTVSIARIFHILIYLSKMLLPLILPGILVVFIKDGIAPGLLFLVELTSATTLSIFSVNIIYMLMLQFMKPQKFKDIIAYFQIAFSTLILGSYILLPRLLEGLNVQKIAPLDYTISYFLPPVWIATLQNMAHGLFNGPTYLLTAMAILSPIACLFGIVTFLSGNFNNKLSLMGSATEDVRKNDEKTDSHNKSLSERLAPYFTSSPLEQLGFKITWKLTSRMQEFKTRVYPSIAYLPMYFIYFVFVNNDNSWSEQWHQLPETNFYLFFLYSIGFLAMVVTRQITKSKKFQAAWFYQITPNKNPGFVLSGMIKSLIVKYLLPVAVLVTPFIFWIWGFGISLNILYALINVLLIAIMMALISARKFPFSEPADMKEQKGKIFLNLLLILVPLGLGFFQAFISEYTLVLAILSVVFAGITWALFRTYKRLTWNNLAGK